MSEKIKWGLLATGAIAQAFAKGIKQSETGELYAVASRDQKKADEFGASARGSGSVKAYGSYEAMLADPEVKAVYISTPHPMHLEWVLKSLEAGKHVLCEKPAGVNQWELQKMLALAAEKNRFFMEAYMYRCHPQTAKIVELIREGAIGKVGNIQATFSFGAGFNAESRIWKNDLGGGGILDVGGYTVSMARLLAGAALGKDFANPIEVKGVAALDNPTGIDAWAGAVMKFEGDIIATLGTGVGLTQENVVRVFGTGGWMLIPNPWVCARETPSEGKIIIYRKGQEEVIEIKPDITTFAMEADVAGRAILAGRLEVSAPAMSRADSLGQIRACDAWRASAGLTYDLEKPEALARASSKTPVRVRPDASPTIPHGEIKGVNKPVAKLIMGTIAASTQIHADAIYSAYYERGGNAFDTAHCYGKNRSVVLGAWINANNIREQVVVISKGIHTPDCYPDVIRKQLDMTLGWLNSDYTDIYMMHRDNPEVPVGEFVEAMNELVREGKIRIFGGSNWSLDRIAEGNAYAKAKGLQGFGVFSNNLALAEMVNPVWAGCIHNHSRADRERIKGMGIVALPWSSQARGFFVPAIARPDILRDQELVNAWYSDDNFKRQARAVELAKKHGVEPINIALAWVLNQPFPCFPLIGPDNILELQSSLQALSVKLTEKEMLWLNLEA